jgi:hypothetical protein
MQMPVMSKTDELEIPPGHFFLQPAGSLVESSLIRLYEGVGGDSNFPRLVGKWIPKIRRTTPGRDTPTRCTDLLQLLLQ